MNNLKKIEIKAYAKINLFLEITEKRPDGYHNIDSVMHKLPLCDLVSVTVSEGCGESGITLECDRRVTEEPRDNLAYRAAEKYVGEYMEARGVCPGAISVKIKKRIPAAAGMAGGSADAAAVLRALDTLCPEPLGELRLHQLAAALGADVPFCLSDAPMRCTGIGDILSPCDSLPECFAVVALGNAGKESTGVMYSAIDGMGSREVRKNRMCGALESGDLGRICAELYNVFYFLYPEAEKIMDLMNCCGASGSLLSGSGPSVFGIFSVGSDASRASDKLTTAGYNVIYCGKTDMGDFDTEKNR